MHKTDHMFNIFSEKPAMINKMLEHVLDWLKITKFLV